MKASIQTAIRVGRAGWRRRLAGMLAVVLLQSVCTTGAWAGFILNNDFESVATGSYAGSTGAAFGVDPLLGNATGNLSDQVVDTGDVIGTKSCADTGDPTVRSRSTADTTQPTPFSVYYRSNGNSGSNTRAAAGWSAIQSDNVNVWSGGADDRVLIGVGGGGGFVYTPNIQSAVALPDSPTIPSVNNNWYHLSFSLKYNGNNTWTVSGLTVVEYESDGVTATDYSWTYNDGGAYTFDPNCGVNLDTNTDAYAYIFANAERGADGLDNLVVGTSVPLADISITPDSQLTSAETDYRAAFTPNFSETTDLTFDFSAFGTGAGSMDLSACSTDTNDYVFTGFTTNPLSIGVDNSAKTITFSNATTTADAVQTISNAVAGTGWVMTNANSVQTQDVEFRTSVATGTVSLAIVAGVPSITSVTPDSGGPGDVVTISGSNFGATQGSSTLTFSNALDATVSYWSDTGITCSVPAGAESGPVTITTPGGSDTDTFTVNWTLTGGGDHLGRDWSPADGLTIGGTHTNIGTFAVTSGATVTVADLNRLVVTAATINVAGTLSADGAGSPGSTGTGEGTDGSANYNGGGGGAYGGEGGRGNTWIAGGADWMNGNDLMYPDEFGSGGGHAKTTGGGVGGGAIKLESLGALNIDGEVNADGGDGANDGWESAGGGSGGSVWLVCDSFSGSGTITADGGLGSGTTRCAGGGGGGGRIAFYYNDSDFDGYIAARGGAGRNEGGDAGTVYNGGSAWFRTLGGDHDGGDWTISSNEEIGGVHYGVGTFTVNAGVTGSVVRTVALVVTCQQATVTGHLSGDAAGGGRQSGDGTGAGTLLQTGGGGGGYGGDGGDARDDGGSRPGGSAWTNGDDLTEPDEFGSDGGGSMSAGGRGGGTVKLDVAGTLLIDAAGSISVNGGTGTSSDDRDGPGGGSGGSIWLNCGKLEGMGSLSAIGGDGTGRANKWASGGGGGGGRIAVYYGGDFVLSTNVSAGSGFSTGSNGIPGTVYVAQYGELDLFNGVTAVAVDDTVDLGESPINTDKSVTLTITNSGDLALSIDADGVSITGGDTGEFSVPDNITGTETNLTAGETATFQITFNASLAGAYTADVQIVSGDYDENPYTFKVRADATSSSQPDIEVRQGGVLVADGSGSYDFGTIARSTSQEAQFVVTNVGAANLYLTDDPVVTFTNGATSQGYFSISTNIAVSASTTNLAPNEGVSFWVKFAPVPPASGAYTAEVSIANSDSDENPYTFDVVGTSDILWTDTGGGNHNGEDWSPTNGTTIAGVHYGVGTFEVGNSVTVSVAQGSALVVTANTVTVTGTLSADEAGHANSAGTGAGADDKAAGGGGYGGHGGNGADGAGGTTYGSLEYPSDLGSGGGDGTSDNGARGGGAIKLYANGTLTVSGTISADGGTGSETWQESASGGGSGGSIWLECGTLAGSGSITADGGRGGSIVKSQAGGGGGGRIALHYASSLFDGVIVARGGLGGHQRGDGGTIYNGGTAWFPTVGGDHGGAPWTIDSNQEIGGVHYGIGTFTINSGVTGTLVRSRALVVTASTANVSGHLDADGAGGGWLSSDGIGDAAEWDGGGGGGGYGGAGGDGKAGQGTGTGGVAWGDGDDERYPDEFGSDGGGGTGGSGGGGGAVKLDISGTLTVDGTISVDGDAGGAGGGGGSGGSIWIECGTIVGSGMLSAVGGAGGPDGGSNEDAGGGGGGRIALHFASGSMAGLTIERSGGAAGGGLAAAGTPGTRYPTPGTLFKFR